MPLAQSLHHLKSTVHIQSQNTPLNVNPPKTETGRKAPTEQISPGMDLSTEAARPAPIRTNKMQYIDAYHSKHYVFTCNDRSIIGNMWHTFFLVTSSMDVVDVMTNFNFDCSR